MARQQYETKDDLENEEQDRRRLEAIFGDHSSSILHENGFLRDAKIGKFSGSLVHSYNLDWYLHLEPIRHQIGNLKNNKQIAWAEYKRRYMYWGQFPSVILSMQKWSKGRALARDSGLPFIFFVGMDDVIAFYLTEGYTQVNHPVEMGGRTNNPRDDGDIEPVIHLPITKFVVVHER